MNVRARALTYAGIVAILLGFAVVAVAWARVAGLTAVPLQLPYLVSGGLTGLGLIMVGVLLVNIQTKLDDAARRDRQLQQLGDILDQIRSLLAGEEPAPPSSTPPDLRDDDTDDVPAEGATTELLHS